MHSCHSLYVTQSGLPILVNLLLSGPVFYLGAYMHPLSCLKPHLLVFCAVAGPVFYLGTYAPLFFFCPWEENPLDPGPWRVWG